MYPAQRYSSNRSNKLSEYFISVMPDSRPLKRSVRWMQSSQYNSSFRQSILKSMERILSADLLALTLLRPVGHIFIAVSSPLFIRRPQSHLLRFHLLYRDYLVALSHFILPSLFSDRFIIFLFPTMSQPFFEPPTD